MKYFSDTEQGEKERVSEKITKDIHNGIVAIYEKYASKNAFSESAGVSCPDVPGICGFDKKRFFQLVKAHIPKLDLDDSERIEYNSDKYIILDFIQFCYSHVKKATTSAHIPYEHGLTGNVISATSYTFDESDSGKESFRNDINTLFRRNGIIFELKETGAIERTIPLGLVPLVSKLYTTKDVELNKLVKEAFERFVQSKLEDRTVALEKIWDAFERMKTYYVGKKKKESIEELIKEVSNENEPYSKLLDEEAKALTNIGNDFRIRHHETGKNKIMDNNQIDYFFYRMVSFMSLFLKCLENK